MMEKNGRTPPTPPSGIREGDGDVAFKPKGSIMA